MVKIGVSGACGKMGRRIISLAQKDKDIEVVFGLENKEHPEVGKVIDGVNIVGDGAVIKDCDCLIDFSAPSASLDNLEYLTKFKKTAVIGTTGFDEKAQERLREAAGSIPLVFSPNMSVGVNVLFKLINMAAEILKDYNVYIEEAHHIHKKDAPSGTAKKIVDIINKQSFDIKYEDVKAIREDEIVGDHKIVFESGVDKIELFHSAKTRDIFAQGSIVAAKWIFNKPKGLYSMADVLF
jgi:4-hydroxy-tetrahydrodipicolinate reductase